MKKVIYLLIILISYTHCKTQKNTLVWSDEFNYSGLPDSAKWGNEIGFIRNNELQYYTVGRIENSLVKKGNLMIIGRREPYNGASYTSASINTLGKYSWKYGRVEARMKLPAGQGMWPAFWMMGENRPDVGWPACGEIDIMEHINNELKVYGTAHWDNDGHVSSGGNTNTDIMKWHVYSIDWDQDSIRWSLDGERYWGAGIKNGEKNLHVQPGR